MHSGLNEQFCEQLNKLRGSKTIILGIGNTLKGDDGAGPLICTQLKGRICAEVIDAGSVPENYIRSIIKKAPQNLLIIDAMDFGASAPAVQIFKPEQLSSLVISTHTLSPRLFVETICRDIEVDVYFIGIQPAQTQLGRGVSVEVSGLVQRLGGLLCEIFADGKAGDD